MAAKKYAKSESGFYKVELVKPFTHAGFTYKPSFDGIVVNEELLELMLEEKVITNNVVAV